jgi:hypothetical protein
MKLASERAVGFWAPPPPTLAAVLARLELLSLRPEFALQREVALTRALRPYLEGGTGRLVAPLPQETALAELSLFCDYYPDDGQLTLIEQLRDVITEHIPGDERAWFDPLKHSYFDVLEPAATPTPDEALTLRSLGDGSTCVVPGGEFIKDVAGGPAVLTRVIRVPDAGDSGRAVWAGCGIALSAADARALMEMTAQWRREMEVTSGSFVLGEWKEFAKRFGYMLLWALAQRRIAALVDAVVHIQYRCADGQPYLYVVALYDHHDYRFFVAQLSDMSEFEPEKSMAAEGTSDSPGAVPSSTRMWVQWNRSEGRASLVARLTLTSSQLIVECDSPERLDRIKHRLAAALGFSLHFRGETLTPPARQLSVNDLMSDEPLTVIATEEEDRALLNQFLEKAYLEWSDQPHLALGGQTPRHAAASSAPRGTVGALIDEMARHDPGVRRTGRPAFNYNRLRAHVGLEEVAE